jgi:predicted nucleotidyltransferase
MKFDPRPYAEHYRAENVAELSAIRERASAALVEARRLAERILREDSGVRAVILFGSLAEDGPRRKDFDIDLALEGGDLYKALDSVEDSAFDVDVVQLDRLPAHILARIDARGIVLAGSRTETEEG